jgi:hypothetical protein
LKGCDPSPGVGVKKLLSKRFGVVEVKRVQDVSNLQCLSGETVVLQEERWKDVTFQALCGLEEKRSKHFVDGDENAARNILWIWHVVTDLQSMLEKHGATQLLFSAR